MKKLIGLLAIVLFAMTSCTKKEYTITGTVEDGLFNEKVYMMERVNREFIHLDSVTLDAKGNFVFTGIQNDPVNRYIVYTDGENDPLFMDFFLENGNIKVKLTQDPTESSVTGTRINNTYQKFKNKMNAFSLKIRALYEKAADEDQRELAVSEVDKVENEMVKVLEETIRKNISTPFGAYMLSQYKHYLDYEVIGELLQKLPANLIDDEKMQLLQAQVDAAKATAVGQKFVDFSMSTPDGEPVSLSDYAGKGNIVLVDFWASWCAPCRREMPRLVEMYALYKDKGFEIVGVSLDMDNEDWKKGIEALNITWPQMSDLKYWDSKAGELYSVRSIPFMVLIDRDGTILARGIYGEELQNKLEEYFI